MNGTITSMKAANGSVILYSGLNFTGDKLWLNVESGSYNLNLIGWGKKANSISVGQGVRVELCESVNCVNDT
jgi:hypothetical protein